MESNATCASTTSATQLYEEQDVQFLTTRQVAKLLNLTVKTVRELTPKIIPGKKYGKAWRYLLSDILANHREDALAVQGKEVIQEHGHLSANQRRSMASGFPLQRSEDREVEEIQAYNWDNHQEGRAEA